MERNISAQMEHLQAKHVGTGHADIDKHTWVTNQHRDSLASYISHYPLLQYMATADNVSVGRLKERYLEKMINPCGRPQKNTENVEE